MSRWGANVITALLVLCAVAVAAASVHREVQYGKTRSGSAAVTAVKDWQSYATEGHVLGSADAPVTIVEFSDFLCPYCARFAEYADSLRSLGENVKVVYRHLPGTRRDLAIPAIRASECAADENKFEGMHDALFTNFDSLGIAPWWWFARTAGVRDSVRFARCVESTEPILRLAEDTAAARRLNANSTPTLLIHETRPRGLPSFDSLLAYVRRARLAASQ
jgi:protein-disulfide isomerase